MKLIEINATELKIGDKVRIAGGDYRIISFVEISSNGKSVFYKFEGKDRKNRIGVNTKVGIFE